MKMKFMVMDYRDPVLKFGVTDNLGHAHSSGVSESAAAKLAAACNRVAKALSLDEGHEDAVFRFVESALDWS